MVLDPGQRTLCQPLGPVTLCVDGGSDSDPPEPDGDARLRARLVAVAQELETAPDVADPSTWFTGEEVVGR